MNGRLQATVGVLVAISVLLTSCAPAAAPGAPKAGPAASPKPAAEQPKSGGVLKHAGFQDEPTYDLHSTGRSLAFDQVGPAYSGLLQYDPADGRTIINDLAESYQISSDGKKVTFVLRKNIKWHDDKAFTAEDVKFNFDRWLKPPEGVAIARRAVVDGVDRVEAPNTSTVEVYLKYPRPAFIPVLASIAGVLLPPQHLKENKRMEFNVLGTGPFKLKEYKRGVSVELVKNKDYFLSGRPYLDGMITYLMPDATARFAALRSGQVRTMYVTSGNISTANMETLKKETDKFRVASFPGLVILLVHFGVKQPPFSDLRVRQAMDMVVDRKKIIDVMEGMGEITGPMPRGPWAIPDDELLKRPGYRGVTPADIEKAKAMLAEAGYPKGFQAEATIIAGYNKQTVFLQDQVKAIGIDVAIKIGDTATVERRQFAHDFAINVILQGEPVDEPDLFLSYYLTGGGRNYGGTSDKQIDDWYAEQSKIMDPAKRRELVLQIQRRVLDLAAPLVLYQHFFVSPYWKCVKGYYPEKQLTGWNNVKRQDVWLDTGCS
ncbi:MAG: ABC transporter substrate-binding protein [Chloroflexi bacterium]|nr:ABC transporter substrate-binding protein [Chloroflexota bacterium]